MEIFTHIQNYILFLRQKGYYVSLSDFKDNFHPYTEKLLAHEIHLHSVCSYLKSNPKTAGMCTNSKKKLSACKIKKATYSCCYAGIEEYIYPIYHDKKRIICIHISGYRDNLPRSVRQMQKAKELCDDLFDELYAQLQPLRPSKSIIESFIAPLKYMILALYEECLKSSSISKSISPTTEIYLLALQFINDNYMNDINAEIVAKKLGYSASYIRAIFKKECGTSLQNKINQIRLSNAVFLLNNTAMNVTDIAFHCGFSDSNYFSTIFKKKYGTSPLTFRKNKGKHSP